MYSITDSGKYYNVFVKVGSGEIPNPLGEIFDQNDEVERSGYRTTEQQVNELLFAGEKLRAYRAELYQWPEGDPPDDYVPPKIDDLVDAQRLAESIRARQRVKMDAAAKAAAEQEAAAKAAAEKDAADLAAFRAKEASDINKK